MSPQNDDLFETPPQPQPKDPAEGSAAAEPKLSDQLSSLTATLGQLAEAQRGTNARVEQLASAVVPQGRQEAEEEPTAGADGKPLSPQARKFSKFYDNPEAFIQQEAGKLVKEQLGPHLLTQAKQKAGELEDSQKAVIDQQFGPGTWDSHYSKDFKETLGKLPIEMQASRDHVEAAVAAIHGRKFLTDDSRTELEKRRGEVAKARASANAPAMLGNGMPRQRTPAGQLTTEQADFLDRLNRNGISYSKEQYLASLEKGSKASNWAKKPAAKSASNA